MKKPDLRFATGDEVELPKRLTKQGGKTGTVVSSTGTPFGESTTVAREVNGRLRHTVVKADELFRLSEPRKQRKPADRSGLDWFPANQDHDDYREPPEDEVQSAVRNIIDRTKGRDPETVGQVVAALQSMAATLDPGSHAGRFVREALTELEER
jgi:Lon protease-like protein